MVDIQSKEVIDKISEDLKVQPAMQIPRELAKQIQLIYNVNPERIIQTRINTAADATVATIHTTSAVKDTFLIGVFLSVSKDVVSTSLNSDIRFVPFGGVSTAVLTIKYEPVTAGQFVSNREFMIPIKLARGSNVTVHNSTNTASIDAGGIINFYETDPQ